MKINSKVESLFRYISFPLIALIVVSISCCYRSPILSAKNSPEIDLMVNNPFTFTILKNYSDNYATIGAILDSSTICPLQRENIADISFCFFRTIAYDGLRINVFSFDVIQSGTAEYLVTNEKFPLRNGIRVGNTINELIDKFKKPYKIKGNRYIWRSSDLHNYLVFTIEDNRIASIRWHEERQPEYKGKVVWETRYE